LAVKALAHKLARASYYVMRDQVEFDPAKLFGQLLKRLFLPLRNLVGMNPVPGADLIDGFLAFDCFQRDLSFELRLETLPLGRAI
jgi:hypothetical protein